MQVSAAADVAVVQSTGLRAHPLTVAVSDPFPGQPVWVAGFPHDPGPTARRGEGLVLDAARVVDYVDGAPMGQRGRVMRLDVPVRPGMSGGPVLDQAGRLAGIVFANQTPTNDALVIPASVLRATLADGLTQAQGC